MGTVNGNASGAVCPVCGGSGIRYGRTKSGLQRYCCRICKRQWIPGSQHRVDPEVKKVAVDLLQQNVKPTVIAKALPGKISLRWLNELRRKMRMAL